MAWGIFGVVRVIVILFCIIAIVRIVKLFKKNVFLGILFASLYIILPVLVVMVAPSPYLCLIPWVILYIITGKLLKKNK